MAEPDQTKGGPALEKKGRGGKQRERERARLADQLIAAEQEERRRISLFLHDGPVQSLSGITLMLDAALHQLSAGNLEEATQVIEAVLERQRSTIKELRDLSFNLEPVVLRDQGFEPAVKALAENVGISNEIHIELETGFAESLAERGRIGGGIAKTFSTSLLLDRVAARLSVPLHVTPIGFKYIAEKMIAGEVGIGGEESGGLGVAFFLPERDGVLSALLVLEAIAHSGLTFDQLLARQDATYGALAYGRRDLRLPMPVLRSFLDGLSASPPAVRSGEKVTGVSRLDGLKLEFGTRGWLLHRLSGTEPIIRIYAEHEDPQTVSRLLDETEQALRALA